ncbi:sigma-70 family RNA polymerase sigma factor [Paractinoplanes lichenicola]|uniref:RNA polymerase sigma factor n=1 Tax=Paractinoplanes lichenicola TaxID=2802976 RepID=A0ABS1VGM8_9ACTN|nr:sigma-70 family RNA polymerase sigma factor [Actinoplanes lichenicola]MBL7253470.1 sigma-70 family RNA polymerase sigma factor [Actinoplanes lichenicola]
MRRSPRTVAGPGLDLIEAARAGDRAARDELVTAELPYLYAVIGRALDRPADVDDVVQETVLQVLRDLPALREPEKFRAWLSAVAHRQVLIHQRSRSRVAQRQEPITADVPDPAGDFSARSVTEMLLSGQRRELTAAARWLDGDDRRLLTLWWQEAAGRLTRAGLAAALGLTPRHTAVRVKRMKVHLEESRLVTRALAAAGCPGLAELTHGWDGEPSGLWRKRLARHVRECARCSLQRRGLVPPEKLLLGAAPVVALPTPTGSFLSMLTTKTTAAAATVAALAGGGFAYAVFTEPARPEAAPAVVQPAVTATVAPRTPAAPAPAPAAATAIFVAPTGSDSGDGSLGKPFATLGKAVAVVRPGQTIALRGGTYRPTEETVIDTPGTARARITLTNYRDERPVIDAARIPADRWAVTHRGGYWTVQGLEIKNSGSQAYACVSCRGVTFRRLSIHDNVRGGLVLRGPGTTGNQVLDSDFFGNHDPDRDVRVGVGLAVKFGSGAGNVVRGNRFFGNADNGFDLGDFADPVTVERNWAWGNGGGFVLGGGSPAPAAAHVLRDNAAWDNADHGFVDEGNAGALRLTRNTAWRNGGDGFSLADSAPRLTGNVAVGNKKAATLTDRATATGNAWDEDESVFRSTDPAVAQGKRRPGGGLPGSTFLAAPPGLGADLG